MYKTILSDVYTSSNKRGLYKINFMRILNKEKFNYQSFFLEKFYLSMNCFLFFFIFAPNKSTKLSYFRFLDASNLVAENNHK